MHILDGDRYTENRLILVAAITFTYRRDNTNRYENPL